MTVTVKPGDSVSKILKNLGVGSYGSRSAWDAVRAANNLNSSYVIYPNQKLVIPDNLLSGTKYQPQAAPAAANPGAAAGATAPGAGGLGFGDILRWQDYFSPELAKSAAAQRSARYFDPLVDESQRSLHGEYAARNLGRSGLRGRDVLKMYKDYADQEAQMREQLYGTREEEARTGYNLERSQYEENPQGYKATPYEPSKGYEYQFPEESPQKYSKSYRDWLREAYKM